MSINQTDKNRYLAERMGVEWCEIKGGIAYTFKDYFTAEGRQELLEWGVEQAWWPLFLYQYFKVLEEWVTDPNWEGDHKECDIKAMRRWNIPIDLLLPVSALAEAVYSYLKERER